MVFSLSVIGDMVSHWPLPQIDVLNDIYSPSMTISLQLQIYTGCRDGRVSGIKIDLRKYHCCKVCSFSKTM